jgi:hypothetical protein
VLDGVPDDRCATYPSDPIPAHAAVNDVLKVPRDSWVMLTSEAVMRQASVAACRSPTCGFRVVVDYNQVVVEYNSCT